MSDEILLAIRYPGGTFYHDPDDQMNTHGPLRNATMWNASHKAEVVQRATMLDGQPLAFLRKEHRGEYVQLDYDFSRDMALCRVRTELEYKGLEQFAASHTVAEMEGMYFDIFGKVSPADAASALDVAKKLQKAVQGEKVSAGQGMGASVKYPEPYVSEKADRHPPVKQLSLGDSKTAQSPPDVGAGQRKEDFIRRNFARKIAECQRRRHLSTSEVCASVGISESTWNEWLTAQSEPSLVQLCTLSMLFMCTVDSLLVG